METHEQIRATWKRIWWPARLLGVGALIVMLWFAGMQTIEQARGMEVSEKETSPGVQVTRLKTYQDGVTYKFTRVVFADGLECVSYKGLSCNWPRRKP